MTGSSVNEQLDDFDRGFTKSIGPDLATVFAGEQSGLVRAGVPADAVAVGDTVPDVRLLDADGSPIDLSTALQDAPAVLVFYRGAWCPYCNITLRAYESDLAGVLRDRGVGLVAISPQRPDVSTALATEAALSFPVLSDPATALIRALHLRTEPTAEARAAQAAIGADVAGGNADATAGLPFPTVLLVDRDRRVVFVDVHVDYTTRTEVVDIVAALDLLG